MRRPAPMVLLVSFASLAMLSSGCDRTVLTTVRPPDLPMSMTSGGAAQVNPTTIAVRIALVQWASARDAPPTVTRTEDEAASRARMITGLARQPGQSFREIQTNYSDASASQLLLRQGETLVPANVVEAAFAMRVGERSLPVRTDKGFYVISRETDPDTGPTTVFVRHVLVSFVEASSAVEGVERTREEARTIIESVHEAAVENPENCAALAAEYSDEPNSEESGGDLGGLTRGQTVPTFERAAFLLEVGAVSPVVTSPYGYHVICRYR